MRLNAVVPLMAAADASPGACDLRMLTIYNMSWLISPHLAFADQ